jgi:hypothetical protein
MPNWTPGTQKGQPVNVKYTVPISFRLDGKAKETATENIAIKDIVNRLPGAKIDENGKVTVNGKAVKKILVDGKPVEDLSKGVDPKIIKLETEDLIIMSKEK